MVASPDICSIVDYVDSFFGAAKDHGAPADLVQDLESRYEELVLDTMWVAPEKLPVRVIEIKHKLADVVYTYVYNNGVAACKRAPWYKALRHVFETQRVG